MKIREEPKPDGIFDLKQQRPKGRHHIMQGYGNHRRNGVATQDIGCSKTQHGFNAKKRGKAYKNSDGHAARKSLGAIMQLEESRCERPEIAEGFL